LPPEKNHQQKANVYGRQEDDDNAHKLLTDKQVNINQTGMPKETHQQGLQKPSPRGMLRRLTIPSLMPKERPLTQNICSSMITPLLMTEDTCFQTQH